MNPPNGTVTRVRLLAFAVMFVIGTDTFLVGPLLPVLRTRFDVPLESSGWLVSSYALAYALSALVAGPASDRRDRKKFLVRGLAVFVVSTALCGFAWDFWSMFAFRFIAGLGAAFAAPQIWASIPVLVPRERLIAVLGTATAGLSIAQVIGIPMGSFLAVVSWRAPFLAVAGLALLLTVAISAGFPAVPAPPRRAGQGSGYGVVVRSRWLLLCLGAYLLFQTGNFCALSFYGSWLAKSFGLGSVGIGLVMMAVGAGNTVGSLRGSRLVARLGEPRSLLLGVLVMGAGYVVCLGIDNLAAAVVVLTLVMMGGGFLFPVLMSNLQSRADGARGTVSSLASGAMYLGTTIGGAVGGPLLQRFDGFRGPAGFAVALYGCSLLVYAAAGVFARPRAEVAEAVPQSR